MYKLVIDKDASFSVTDMKNFQQCPSDSGENKGGAGFVKVFAGEGCFKGGRRARKSGEKVHVKRANMMNAIVVSVSIKDERVMSVAERCMSSVILSGSGLNDEGVHCFYECMNVKSVSILNRTYGSVPPL
jgi:hypothetical protein